MDLISFDLDGTLLNSQMVVSPKTRTILSQLVKIRGAQFTFATARSLNSALRCLHEINIELPIILNNGSVVWCNKKKKFIDIVSIADEKVSIIFDLLESDDIHAIFMGANFGSEYSFYSNSDEANSSHRELVEDGVSRRQSLLQQGLKIFNINAFFKNEIDSEILDNINSIKGLNVHYDCAIYNKGYWTLDINSSKEDKGTQLLKIKNENGFSRLIGFGDGVNDLSVAAVCDEFYAPHNADSEVISASTGVIGSNDQDGIADYLKRAYFL